MQEQLELPQAALDENLIIELVNRIRPADPNDANEVKSRIDALVRILVLTPASSILLRKIS